MKQFFQYITIIFIALILTACGKTTDSDETESSIFDRKGLLITTLSHDKEFPPEFAPYLSRVIYEVIRKTEIDPFKTVMHIYTEIDVNLQRSLYNEMANNATIDNSKATIVKENKTGNVIAFYDETFRIKDFRTNQNSEKYDPHSLFDYQFNEMALMLPINAYALSFEYLDLSTADFALDEAYHYPGTAAFAKNRDNEYLGVIPLQTAFDQGRISSMYLDSDFFKTYGIEGGCSIKSDHLGKYASNESIMKYVTCPRFEVSDYLADVTTISNGYQMILNEGVFKDTRFVNEIKLIEDGSVIKLEYRDSKLLSQEASFLVTNMLSKSIKTSPFLDEVINKERPYSLYGYASMDQVLKDEFERWHLLSSIVATADYSMVTSYLSFNKNNEPNNILSMQTAINKTLDELTLKYSMTPEIIQPLGLVETNYAPGQINEKGLDPHNENLSNKSNLGLKKRR